MPRPRGRRRSRRPPPPAGRCGYVRPLDAAKGLRPAPPAGPYSGLDGDNRPTGLTRTCPARPGSRAGPHWPGIPAVTPRTSTGTEPGASPAVKLREPRLSGWSPGRLESPPPTQRTSVQARPGCQLTPGQAILGPTGGYTRLSPSRSPPSRWSSQVVAIEVGVARRVSRLQATAQPTAPSHCGNTCPNRSKIKKKK